MTKKITVIFTLLLGFSLFLTSCFRSWVINIDDYILHKIADKYYIAQIPDSARKETTYEIPTHIGEYEIYGFGSDKSYGIWAGSEKIQLGHIKKIIIKSNIKSVCFDNFYYPLLIETEQPLSQINWNISVEASNYSNCFFLSPKEELNVKYVDETECFDGIIYGIKDDGFAEVLFNYSNEFMIHNEYKNVLVNEISEYAFANSSIDEITIPINIGIISDNAFKDSLLEKVVFNDNIIKIGKSAFENCQLKELSLPDVRLEIEADAFRNNNIKDIVIPENISYLGNGVFSNNKIENFKFKSKNIRYISERMFYGCPLTGELDYGEYISSIRDNALSNNERVELVIPDTILEFGDLSYCKSLKKIYLPNSSINIGTFTYLENLEELHLGGTSNLNNFEKMHQLNNLKLITVSDNNQYIYTKNGILYDKNTNAIVKCPPKLEIENIEINIKPYVNAFSNNIYIKEVTINCELPERLFSYCVNLEKVKLHSSIKIIPKGVFYACHSLKEINLNNTVEIGEEAFFKCKSLIKVDLSNCEIVNVSGFEQCDLYEVIFTSKIKEIKKDAFKNNKNLKKCNYYNAILHEHAFYDTPLFKSKK